MAMCVSNLTRNTFSLLKNNVLKNYLINATRQLYAPVSMGIPAYENVRETVKSQFQNVDNVFREKMINICNKSNEAMVFTEDLKTMVHLVQKEHQDLELLIKMMKKFHAQNNLRFSSYIFGTVAMRAFHYLNEPDVAFQAFKDPELESFFDQIMSFQILLDLLLVNERYDEVIEAYDIIKMKNVNGVVHPRNAVILLMASCYKQNNLKSYSYAIKLFKELQGRGFEFPRRAITFVAALALRRNQPEIALEICSASRNLRYIDIRCIKLEACIQLKRFDEIMITLRSSVLSDNPAKRKECVFRDTFEKIEAAVKEENMDENSEIVKLIQQMKLHDFIQDLALDEHMWQPIETAKAYTANPMEERGTRNYYSYQRMHQRAREESANQSKNSYRPGLRDLL